jgi:hypothetical protein
VAFTDAALSWLNVVRLAILLFTALLGWITYRSHLLLKEFQPDFNLLLSWPENLVRLLLVGFCLVLAWLSGLSPTELGLYSEKPLQMMMTGLAVGLVTVIVINLLTHWAVKRFGRQIYSPQLVQNILPQRPTEWILVALAFLPAVAMEELLFRTLWLSCFQPIIPLWLLILVTSVLFGLMHQPQGQLGMILAGSINVVFAILFVWSGQLLLPLTAHYTTNFCQLLVAHYQRDWLKSY